MFIESSIEQLKGQKGHEGQKGLKIRCGPEVILKGRIAADEGSFEKKNEMYKNNISCMKNVINFCKANKFTLQKVNIQKKIGLIVLFYILDRCYNDISIL